MLRDYSLQHICIAVSKICYFQSLDAQTCKYFSRRNELLSQGGNPAPDCPGLAFIAWVGPGSAWARAVLPYRVGLYILQPSLTRIRGAAEPKLLHKAQLQS